MTTIFGAWYRNKIFQVQYILIENKLDPNNSRREETTLTRQRIEHYRLTHSILNDEPSP